MTPRPVSALDDARARLRAPQASAARSREFAGTSPGGFAGTTAAHREDQFTHDEGPPHGSSGPLRDDPAAVLPYTSPRGSCGPSRRSITSDMSGATFAVSM